MDKETIKAFIDWLEAASEDEIEVRRQAFLQAKEAITTREGRADINLGLRLIDEELIARLELKGRHTI